MGWYSEYYCEVCRQVTKHSNLGCNDCVAAMEARKVADRSIEQVKQMTKEKIIKPNDIKKLITKYQRYSDEAKTIMEAAIMLGVIEDLEKLALNFKSNHKKRCVLASPGATCYD